MTKVFLPNFTINIASKPKQESRGVPVISRKVLAIVAKIDNEYKAIINHEQKEVFYKEGDTTSTDKLILPFTEQSLSPKDKTYVWTKFKDKTTNKQICIIRDIITANLHPGTIDQYDTVIENLLIAGFIVRKDGKMLFKYTDLIAFHYANEGKINIVQIDETKPIFNK